MTYLTQVFLESSVKRRFLLSCIVSTIPNEFLPFYLPACLSVAFASFTSSHFRLLTFLPFFLFLPVRGVRLPDGLWRGDGGERPLRFGAVQQNSEHTEEEETADTVSLTTLDCGKISTCFVTRWLFMGSWRVFWSRDVRFTGSTAAMLYNLEPEPLYLPIKQ